MVVGLLVACGFAEAIFVQPVAAAPTSPPAQAVDRPAADPKHADQPVVLDPADEMPDLRTASSRTYDLGAGQYAVEAFPDPVFYLPEGSETFEPIDLDFNPTGETATVTAAPVEVEVGAKADGLVRLGFDDHEISLRPIDVAPVADGAPADTPAADVLDGEAPALEAAADVELPSDAAPVVLDAPDVEAALAAPVTADEPATDRQRADIADVLPGVDLRVFAHANGTSNFLVLDAAPAQTSWTFAVTSPGLALTAGEHGALSFVDAAGKPVATMPAPYAVDSTPDERTGSGRTTTAAWYTLANLDGQALVTVSVDPDWLKSAVYPVYVDPSVTVYNEGTTTNGDVHVNEGNPTFAYGNYQRPDSPYYYEMWLGESPSNSSYFNMAFIQFNLAAYYGNVVDDASLEVRPYHQYYDAPTSTRTYLRRVTETWSETITWNTRPSATSSGMTYADCVEGQQCSFDITAIADNWFDGDSDDNGIRLDEIDTNGNRKGPTYWKRLIAAEQGTSTRPRLIITYHNPAAPAYPSGGPTSSRTLSWTTDARTTTSGYSVQVATDTGFTNIVASSGAITGSPDKGWAIPSTTTLTPGTTYYWRVKIARTGTASGTRWSPFSAYASFTYDPDANLGSLGYNSYESFDLGGSDSLAANVSTGNLVLSHPVVTLPIRGGSLPIGLTYNSFDPTDVGLGAGWRLNLQRSVSVSGTNATFTDADGARHLFTGASTTGTVTTWTRPATIYASLRRDTAQTGQEITVTYRDQSKDTFRASDGRLVKTQDRFGNAVTLGYAMGSSRITTITDPASRTVNLAWTTSPDRLTSITDWANVNGSGVVQASGTGNRATRFFYTAAGSTGTLAGWADPLNTTASAACPSVSHTTCLTWTSGQLTSVAKYQTTTTLSGTTLGTGNRMATTTIGYRGTEVASVQDASQGSSDATTFARGAGTVTVVRKGTPNATTTYGLQAATDAYGRVKDVTRTLGAGGITQRTTWDTTYPTEPASVAENYGASPSRTVSYTYQASSLGLLSRLTEPLDGTYSRWTDYTYNSNNDVTQRIVSRQGDATLRTTTRFCYTTSGCSTSATDLLLRSTIENYVDGTAGNGTASAEDILTSYTYDAYGQRTLETRTNYKSVAGVNTLLDQRATGATYNSDGTVATSVANYANGTVSGSGDDVTPNATTGARTDLTTVYTYDSAGNQASVADPRRAIALAQGTSLNPTDYVTTFTNDALGEQRSETTPRTPGSTSQKTSSSAYDELGNVRTSTDLGGLLTATEYDAASRATRTFEVPAGSSTATVTSTTVYDLAGRVTSAKDREQSKTGSTAGATTTTYDDAGRATQVTEAAGTAETTTSLTAYDGLDRVTCTRVGWTSGSCTSVSGAGQATIATYDAGGRAITTDDQFSCTTRTYDYRDLATGETTGLAGTTCLSGAETRAVTNTYDGLGRQTRSEVTSGTGTGDRSLDVTLDSAGRQLTSASRTSGTTLTTTYTLNPLDQILAEAPADGSTTKTTYDAAGNATDRCYWKPAISVGACLPVGTTPWTNPPTQATTTAYDARNQRVSLANATTNSTTTYDADHNYQPNGFYLPTASGKEHQTLFEYDERHRLDDPNTATPGIVHQLCATNQRPCIGANILASTGSDTYEYDDNDNRTRVSEANGAMTSDRRYCYDALNRLVYRNTGTACSPSAKDEAYTYDEAGNRTSTVIGATTNTFTYTAGQLTGCTTNCGTVTHDTAGNVSRLGSWSYEYDQEGRLTKACKAASCATGTADRVEFAYDGEGHRIEERRYTAGTLSTTIGFRYQGDAIVEETTNGTVSRSYLVDDAGTILRVCDPTCTSPTASYLPVWNGHGDATALYKINGDGTLTLANSYTYDTWGTPTTAVHDSIADLGFRFLYVGEHDVQWDNAYGLGLTYMHARHYSPFAGLFLQPDPASEETNLYVYAENSPASKTDPDGLRSITIVTNAAAGSAFELRYIKTLERFGWKIHSVHGYEPGLVKGYKRGRFIDIVASKNGRMVRIELKTGGSRYFNTRQFLHDVKMTVQRGTPTRIVRYDGRFIRSARLVRAGRGWALFFGGGGHLSKMR